MLADKRPREVLVIGAGFTGLAAAVELCRLKIPFTLVEREREIGGLSKTFVLEGKRFELGPHIYFDKDYEVTEYWRSFLGDSLKSYSRNNRIYFRGRFIKSPLSVMDAIFKIGFSRVVRIVSSFFLAKYRKYKVESAEDWVISNFGKGLYDYFFKVYNEKIWGLPCDQISANWAGQRIKSNLVSMVFQSLSRKKVTGLKTFDFPDEGSASLSRAQLKTILESNVSEVKLGSQPTEIIRNGEFFGVSFTDGHTAYYSHIIATCHLDDLADMIRGFDIDPERLRSLTEKLIYRNLIVVNFVFDKSLVRGFNEHWIDIHDPKIKALRVTNFSSFEKSHTESKLTGIGVEYNCFAADSEWALPDERLIQLAIKDLHSMSLVNGDHRVAAVVRVERAYPVYFTGFEETLESIMAEFEKIKGLQMAGRNAMYRWNNMHHSVKTGLLAARNCAGADHDLASVTGMITFGKEE